MLPSGVCLAKEMNMEIQHLNSRLSMCWIRAARHMTGAISIVEAKMNKSNQIIQICCVCLNILIAVMQCAPYVVAFMSEHRVFDYIVERVNGFDFGESYLLIAAILFFINLFSPLIVDINKYGNIHIPVYILNILLATPSIVVFVSFILD